MLGFEIVFIEKVKEVYPRYLALMSLIILTEKTNVIHQRG